MAKQGGAEKAGSTKEMAEPGSMLDKKEAAGALESARQPQLEGNNEADKRIKELEERLMRLQADFQNHIKRSERRQAESADAIRASLLADILPVVDQLEYALAHEKTESEFKKGIAMIYRNLMATLENLGLKEMDSYERFDPYLHEAVRAEKGDDGKILEIIQKGYMFKGKVLRHAKVVVGRKG